MQIFLAGVQGFCSGVTYAIDIVEAALKKCPLPLYVYHEIVHNTYVVNDFKSRGVIFVEDINEVPEGKTVILSAHGVPPEIFAQAQKRKLKVIDATCPLVNKVHKEAIENSRRGYEIVLIGHKNHQEIIGTAGYVTPKLLHIIEKEKDVERLNLPADKAIAYLTQTTLSVDDTKQIIKKLKAKFPKLISQKASDICYATQNRQDAVKELAKICDVIIICGSPNSSNSNRLRETGEKCGCPSFIIDSAEELDFKILAGKERIGISSGASVPRQIVDAVIRKIQERFPNTEVKTFANLEKDIKFKLPEI